MEGANMKEWQQHARELLCGVCGVTYPTSEIEDFLTFYWQNEATDEENINEFINYKN